MKRSEAVMVGCTVVVVALTAVVLWQVSKLRGAPNALASPVGPAAPAVDDSLPVYPTILQGTKSLELGQLVLLLMPKADEAQVGWDYRVDSPIVWLTKGYDSGGTGVYTGTRSGIIRVNVQGTKATELRKKITELGWTITYRTEGNPAHGPTEIEMKPGGEKSEDICFGSTNTGCEFDEPGASLAAVGVHMKTQCTDRFTTTIWELTAPGRRPVALQWVNSEGSGGGESWLVLLLRDEDAEHECKVMERDASRG